MEKSSRRDFCKTSSKLVIGAGLASMMPLVSSCSANDKIVVGAIGLRNQGFANLRSFLKNPNVECAAICDIDDEILNRRSADIEKINAKRIDEGEKLTVTKPKQYKDYRKLLEDPDIDAIIIGTPDHWHCMQDAFPDQRNGHPYPGRLEESGHSHGTASGRQSVHPR